MRSRKPRALLSASTLALTLLGVTACASGRPILTTQPAPCSTLIAGSLRADVEAVDPPGLDATAGDIWKALDGQTGRLDQANANRRAAIETVERCEGRDKATTVKLTAPWWKRPFSGR